jgi:hypothetical protein
LDPTTLGTKLEATLGGAHVTKNEIVVESLPALTFATRGKVCFLRVQVGVTLVPISGDCDPVNIGTHPLRIVHAHIVSEGKL